MKKKTFESQISRDNRELVALAVKCKFINTDQENEVLTQLFKELTTHPENNYSVIHIFEKQNILSREDIGFLLAVKKHLKTKLLDKKFSKLAMANYSVSLDVIKNAFHQQTVRFRKTRETFVLGDLLVKDRKMSEAECTAVLLTQDRITDEYLADAMNKLAVTEFENLAINKRFGSIAVKNGFISMNKINEALKIQKNEKIKNLAPRYLGEILEQSFGLPHKVTLEILREQKQYEKRRLNLEKALHQYNSEIKTNQVLSTIFEHWVSQDKLEAYVRINRNFSEEIVAYDFFNWIKLMGIQFGLADDTLIQNFLMNRTKGSKLKIAQGIPAQKGKPGSLEFYFNTEIDKGISFVKKGTVLAKRVPHKEGSPGKNVFGQIISPPRVDTCPLRRGRGVAERNQVFVADIDGTPVLYQQRTLFVRPLSQSKKTLNITGDITSKVENAYSMVNLKINGSILQGAFVRCHNLEVDGNVMGNIKATGDVDIKGRVQGKPVNKDKPGDQLTIASHGNILVSRKVENARIMADRTFQAINADVVTSVISARQGIFIKNVYSEKRQPSVLQIGKKNNCELNLLQSAIDENNKELRALKRVEEMEEMEESLYQQIQVQDNYRERQNALSCLIKIIGNSGFEDFDIYEKGFDFFETVKKDDAGTGREIFHKIPQGIQASKYFQKILDKIKTKSPKIRSAVVREMLEDNIGMYKAAVNITKRMEKEYIIRSNLIREETDREKIKIKAIEKKLDDLIMEKEFLALKDEQYFLNIIPEIRIKNQLSQGTVIEAAGSGLVIDKTIYGIKLKEITNNGKSNIIIEGYFE